MIKFKSLAEQAHLKKSAGALIQSDPTTSKELVDHAALGAAVIRAGKIRRGELPEDPKPIDARAQFILDSAKRARGED